MLRFDPKKRASFMIVASFFMANLLVLLFLQSLKADKLGAGTADLTGSAKLVDQAEAMAEATLHYSIIISNSGSTSVTASLNDQLPTGIMVVSGSLTATAVTAMNASPQLITWTATVQANEVVTVSFDAVISTSLSIGEVVTNTAVLTGTGQAISRTATTTIIGLRLYLPFISKPLSAPTLNPISRNCTDSWTLNWSDVPNADFYELQMAHNSSFNPVVKTAITGGTSVTYATLPSFDNDFYYRVRGLRDNVTGSWSNTELVVGNYFDQFEDPSSGWVVTDDSIANLSYSNGRYAVRAKQAGYLISVLSPNVSLNDYTVSATMQWQNTSDANGIYGLIFGASNDISKYYFVAIYAHLRAYRVYFFDSTLPLADRLSPVSNFQTTTAVQPGTAVNEASVTRTGSNIALTINNIAVGNWSDSRQTGDTRTGVLVTSNPNNPVITGLFDDFRISYCGTATAVATSTLYTTNPPHPAISADDLDWAIDTPPAK
jgi:uncharacterized repeat protein (TIGR01451 family)